MAIERMGFEHQKDINLEAYTYGLVNRIDLNFKGIVEDYSNLPLLGNQTNDSYYVRNGINNRMYIWNGSAWAKDSAGGGGGTVNYTTFPTTTGNRLIQSIGTNADLIEETVIEVNPTTGDILFPNTIEVTFESGVNFNNNEVNYNNSEVNFDSNSEVNMYGDTFIENLEIENITLGPNPDLTDLISTDANNQLTPGSDDKLFVPPISVNRGSIGGTLSNQTDLQSALDAKVTGPATNTDNYIPQRNGNNSKTLKDGLSVVTTVGTPGSDSNIPTEQAVREAISAGSSGVVTKIGTYLSGESISMGDHVCLAPYIEEQTDDSDEIKSYSSANVGVSVPVNYGEAFVLKTTGAIKTLSVRFRMSTVSESGGSNQRTLYSLTANIYAVTGTVGSTAVNTGSALRTSNTISGNVTFTTVVNGFDFTFASDVPLPAGDYAFKIEGSIESDLTNNSGILRVFGDNTGGYLGNAIDGSSAVAGSDVSFEMGTDASLVFLGDASNANRLQYLGQSLETVTSYTDVDVQVKGPISQTGASSDQEMWYLSDTPGELSSTPGTNVVFVARGYDSDVAMLRGYSDVSLSSYDDSFSGISDTFYSAGGCLFLLNTTSLNTDSGSGNYGIQISEDGTDWIDISKIIYTSTSGTSNQYNNSVMIPANRFIKTYFNVGAGSPTWTYDISIISF